MTTFSTVTPEVKPPEIDEKSLIESAFDLAVGDESIEIGDAAINIGTSFLEGMAANSKLSLEQKMAMKALEALVGQISTNLAAEPSATSAASSAQLASSQDVLGSLTGG